MRPRPLLAVALLGLAALAGCAGPGTPTATEPPGRALAETFDMLAPGTLPANWTTHRGSWGAAGDSDPAHPLVLRGAGEAEPGLSSIVAPGAFTDFNATVMFKMLSGEHPQGAGLAFHFVDEGNYQIIRYSTTENGWHLFTVTDGNRQKHNAASVVANETHPDLNQWVTLRVTSKAGHVEAFDGATKVIDFQTPAGASRSGRIGPFVRGDTVALFDDFKVA